MTAFKAEVSELDNAAAFKHAEMIAAAKAAYNYVFNNGEINEEAADYLLRFDNPLIMLASAWLKYPTVDDMYFEDMLNEMADSDGFDADIKFGQPKSINHSGGDTSKMTFITELLNLCERHILSDFRDFMGRVDDYDDGTYVWPYKFT